MRTITSSWITGTAACCLALVMGACGGSSSSGAAATGGVAAAESVAASAAADPDDDANGSGDAALFSDDEACAWLKETMPKVKAAANDVDAQLVLTFGLSTFFEEHGGLEKADGYAFDEATTRGCKAQHDAALEKAGIKSFGNL